MKKNYISNCYCDILFQNRSWYLVLISKHIPLNIGDTLVGGGDGGVVGSVVGGDIGAV